jgi:hypothetical protein
VRKNTKTMADVGLIVLGLFVLASVALVTTALFRPQPPRPAVTAAFLGCTNDNAGTRLASFTVSNQGPSAVRRLSDYRIQIPTAQRWTNLYDGYLTGGSSVLPSGRSEIVTVVAPTNQPSWRPWFRVNPDVGVVSDTVKAVVDAARAAGLTRRYRKTFGVDCDWVRE